MKIITEMRQQTVPVTNISQYASALCASYINEKNIVLVIALGARNVNLLTQ